MRKELSACRHRLVCLLHKVRVHLPRAQPGAKRVSGATSLQPGLAASWPSTPHTAALEALQPCGAPQKGGGGKGIRRQRCEWLIGGTFCVSPQLVQPSEEFEGLALPTQPP